jgi:hypothetical protein
METLSLISHDSVGPMPNRIVTTSGGVRTAPVRMGNAPTAYLLQHINDEHFLRFVLSHFEIDVSVQGERGPAIIECDASSGKKRGPSGCTYSN